MKRTLIALSVFIALAGCKKAAPIDDVGTTLQAPALIPTTPSTVPEAVSQMKKQFERVHFEYDSSILDEPSKSALAENSRVMQAHPSIVIEVQGHADERGTVEYNIGLGDRRAEAIRKHMVTMGVASSRITTLSYGEERPLDASGGEVAWSQNRRGEFRIIVNDTKTAVLGTVEK